VLLSRQLLLLWKDPSLYIARAVMNMIMVSVFSIVYIEARHRIQTQAQQRCFFFVFCMAIPSNFAIGVVILSNLNLKSVAREVKDGMYHPICQWIAQSIVQAPMMLVLAACALWPAFWGAQLPSESFFAAALIFSSLLWTFEGIAEFFSLVRNPLAGMLYFLFFFIFAFLFCGMFVAFEDVIIVLRWICYITPLGYAMRSMLFAIMDKSDPYTGATNCVPGTPIDHPDFIVDGTATACPARGFYCPEDPLFISCFGVTGNQILDSIGVNFPVISGTDVRIGEDVLKVVAIGAVFRMLFVAGLLKISFSYKPVRDAGVAGVAAAQEKEGGAGDVEAGEAKPIEKKSSSLNIAAEEEVPKLDNPKTEFTFANVGYVIPKKPFPKAPEKALLTGISATCKAGEVLAVVGPSGAGKTILLNTLTLEKGPGVSSGTVAINGHSINQRVYIQQCAYVPRDDILWPTLTARQHIETAASLFCPSLLAAERAAMVDELLEQTGMTSCQHTKAGSALIQGLSGGQRRRLSLALALVKRPRVVVLDEPTSGLDSAAAAAIMRLLKKMAVQTGASILCTIHQPSAAVYGGFDSVLVLSMGRMAYCGPAKQLKTFFEGMGKSLPSGANPAEFVLDEVSPEMSSSENVLQVLDAFANAAPTIAVPAPTSLDTPPVASGLCGQTWIVFQRTVALSLRDPVLYVSRMVLIVVLICCFGLIYVESRAFEQEQVMPRLFLCNWVCTMPSVLNLITVLALNQEYTNARAEMKNGMYSPVAYMIATTLVQVPMMVVLSLCALVPGYLVGNWNWEGFPLMVIIYASNFWCFETMAQLFSLGSNAIFGMFNFIQMWSVALMFNGIVFRGQDVVGILRWMYFGFPLKWFMNALCFTVFDPAEYSGVANCNFTSNLREYNASLFEGIGAAMADVQSNLTALNVGLASMSTLGGQLQTTGAQLADASCDQGTRSGCIPDNAAATTLQGTLASLTAQFNQANASVLAAGATAQLIGGYLTEMQNNAEHQNYTLPPPYAPTVDLRFTSVADPDIVIGLEPYREMMTSSLGCFRGFYCPNSSDPLQCFGSTGSEILSTLNANYESISEKDDRLLDVIVMLILAGAFKCMYVLFVLLDINTRVMIREFLNLNAPNLVVVSCIIVTFIALGISGESYGAFPWLD